MGRMKLAKHLSIVVIGLLIAFLLHAGVIPKFTIVPKTATTLEVFANSNATVQYQVSNNTQIARALTIVDMPGVSQITSGNDYCARPFFLAPNQSCLLALNLDGSKLPSKLDGGPQVCKTMGPGNDNPSPDLCSQPNPSDVLHVVVLPPLLLTSITVTPTNTVIAKGTSQQLTAMGNYSDGSVQDLTRFVSWTSSSASVSFSGDAGLATGVAPGASTVIATYNGVSGVAFLAVTEATLVGIEVSPLSPSIAKGSSEQFSAIGTFSDLSTQNISTLVTWTSSDESTATISNALGSVGLATGVSAGSTTITATYGSVSAAVNLTITPATLVSIAITPAISVIAKGTTQQFTATGNYSDSSTQDLTNTVNWASSDTSIATISNTSGTNGLANGVSPGTVIISAELDSVLGSSELDVTNASLTSIAVTPATASIAKETTQLFTATGTFSDASTQNISSAVSWTSSDTTVGTVSNAPGINGLATGTGGGSTTITASSGTTSASAHLNVSDVTLVSIIVTPGTPSIAKGTKQQFTATGVYSDSSTQDITSLVSWSSSGNSIASISNAPGLHGLATGIDGGSVTIQANLNAVTGSASLTITDAVLVSLALTPTNLSIAKGVSQQFIATGTFSDASTQDLTNIVTWSSTDTSKASMGVNGIATAIGVGSTTIKATSAGITGTTGLTITPAALLSIMVTPVNAFIAKGITQQFTATGTYSDASTQDLTSTVHWTSSATSSATISNAGLATAVAPGPTTITASSGSVSGTAYLAVSDAVLTSITINPTTATLAKGETQQFTATGSYSDASTQNITSLVSWTSSDTGKATISNAAGSNGIATGVGAGASTITATLGSVSSTAALTVTDATLVSIALTPGSATIVKSTTQQLTATGIYSDASTQDLTSAVVWSSSATGSATVSQAGVVTGVAPGAVTITATSSGGVSSSSQITVTDATLLSIAVTPATPSIAKGTTKQFIATGTYSDGSTQNITSLVTWSSSDITKSTISNAAGSNGIATGVAAGASTITATLDSVSSTAALTVTNATLVSIALTPGSATIAKGTTQQLTATGTYSDSSTQDLSSTVSWSSSATGSATVSNAGLVSGVAPGAVTITATSGGVSSSSQITVTDATLLSIAVTPATPSIAKGTTKQFIATGTYSDASTQNITSLVTWSSSDITKATISNAADSNGIATGLAAGSSTITATKGSVSSTANLTVTSATLVSIAVTPANASIAKGTTQQFTATGTYSDASTQDLTSAVSWSSSATGSATVSGTGLASGVAPGAATITATFVSVSGTAYLDVSNATLLAISVTPATPSIAKGLTQQFTATGSYSDSSTQDITSLVTWSSSNSATATISNAAGSNGFAMAVGTGNSTITATSGAVSGTAGLTVNSPTLVSIAIAPTSIELTKGATQQFTATGTYSDSSTQDLTSMVSWSSSATGRATISSAGLASGLQQGAVVITATYNSVSGTANLDVIDNISLTSITVSPATPSIAKGLTQQFKALGTYSDSSTQDITSLVTWSSSSTATATISNAAGSNGLATGAAVGSSTITATYGSVSANATLNVTAVILNSIAVTPVNPSIADGYTQQFTATGYYSDGSTANLTSSVTWNSGTTSVATIASNGLATTITPGVTGTSLITATLGALSATSTLTVNLPVLTGITVTPATASVVEGTSKQFKAVGTYSDGTSLDVSSLAVWTTSNSSSSRVNTSPSAPPGVATTFAVGTSTITATIGAVNGSATLTSTVSAAVTVTASVSKLTLLAGGHSRQIKITNTGPGNLYNVSYNYSPALPSDTATYYLKQGLNTTCTLMAKSGSCTITITPGPTPTAAAGDPNPTPVILTVQSDNGNVITIPINILTLGSYYQGGFLFSVDDSANCGYNAHTLGLSPTVLPAAVNGTPYSAGPTISNATGPDSAYTYSVTAGSLPTGLSLQADTGAIFGTPTVSGTFTFTITATDAASNTGSKSYTIVVGGPLALSPSIVPQATINTAYTQTVTASGGTAPYTYSLITGSLPPGLSMNSAGVISGTPTTTGTYGFFVKATDAGGVTGVISYALTVNYRILLSPSVLVDPVRFINYNQTMTASGGTPPYTYAITSGSGAGLILSSSGVLSGSQSFNGYYGFIITATDANSVIGRQGYSVNNVSCSDSIAGKVVAPVDQGSIQWAPDATTNIAGIYESSLVSGGTSCNGANNGSCDSGLILAQYTPTSTYPLNTYAAGLCKSYTGGSYSDWYLPSVCEAGPGVVTSGYISRCPVSAASNMNMQDNLSVLINSCTGSTCLSGTYWTSTESSSSPASSAWNQTFQNGSNGGQVIANKSSAANVRCVRATT